MAENVFKEDSKFLMKVRDAVKDKDTLEKEINELKSDLKKQEREVASQEKALQDEVDSTLKKRRNEVTDEFDKQISAIKSRRKKVEAARDKRIDEGKASRIREESKEHEDDTKEAEKELRKLFRKEKVPAFARTRLFYVMFMPDGIVEILMMLCCYGILFAGIPTLITFLLRITVMKNMEDKTKTILCIIIPAVLIILFMIAVFMVYVKVKARHIRTLRLGRKYRNMVNKNDRKIREIRRSVEKDTDESQYGLDEFDQKLEEIRDEEEEVREKLNEALKTFDEETAVNIRGEIEERRMPAIEEARKVRDELAAGLEEKEKAYQAKSLEISEGYVSHIGEDMMRPEKLDDLVHIMESGEADTISEALSRYRDTDQS